MELIDTTTRPDSIIWTIGIKNGVELTSTAKQQTAYVYRGDKGNGTYGLYRVIKFTLISQFEIEHIDTYPGLWEDWETVPWDWSDDKREIGQGIDAPLTLFFELQEGLPESIFPLEFVIESSKQNIQNAYQGNAVVKTVPAAQSLFWNNGNGGVNTARIQFVKTVTWEDYNTVGTTESPATGSRIVRCRFLTTTDLAQDGIGGAGANGESTTTLKVSNPYFAIQKDGFTRNTETSDPSPRNWDFSSPIWASVITDLSGAHTQYTASNNSTEGLIIFESSNNATNRISSDKSTVGEDTYSYIQFNNNNNNDYFKYPLTYSGGNARTLRIEVMCTNTNGVPTAPIVRSGGTAVNNTLTLKDIDTTTSPYSTYVYEREIAKSNNSVTADIYIYRTSGTATRFYKINVYPQYELFNSEGTNP